MRNLFLVLSLILFSCSEGPEELIPYVEGYWEIKKVTLPNGFQKEYTINETIDFIRVNDSLKGFRKKLKPGINNTYYTSEDAEAIQLKIEDDSLRIYYTTPYNTWKETVLSANENELVILNKNKAVYLYNRYESIELSTAK
jgi:hypothetical protein